MAVRWYVRYRLSYAEVSEWVAERGILVDQNTGSGIALDSDVLTTVVAHVDDVVAIVELC